jgi:hypothetical protein
MLNHLIDEREAAEVGAKLKSLLLLGDTRGEVNALIEKQRAAEEQFQRRGYAAWSAFPRHPFAAGLLAYERWLAGSSLKLSPVLQPFIESAYVVESFRHDWDHEATKFAANLRSTEALSFIFELMVLHQHRLAGNRVRYIFPQESGTFDGLIHGKHELEVECKLTSSEARRRVPYEVAVEVYSQILQFMQKSGIYSVVSIICSDQLARADINVLAADVRASLLQATPLKKVTTDGRFMIEILPGGTPQQPLDPTDVSRLLSQIDAIDASTINVMPASKTVIVPNRYLVQAVSIDAADPDNALSLIVRAAGGASHQLTGTRPGIVAVGFGSAILRDQPDLKPILASLQKAIIHELRQHPKVSAVQVMFQREGTHAGTPIRGGLMLQGWTDGLVYAFRSPHATKPIPRDFPLVPSKA